MEVAETEGDVDGAVRSSATEEEKVETEDEKEAEIDAGERVEVEGNDEAADVPNQIDVPDPILEDPNIPDEVPDEVPLAAAMEISDEKEDDDEPVSPITRPKRSCVQLNTATKTKPKKGGGDDPDDPEESDDEVDVHSEYSTESDVQYEVREDYWRPFNVTTLASDIRRLKTWKKLCYNCGDITKHMKDMSCAVDENWPLAIGVLASSKKWSEPAGIFRLAAQILSSKPGLFLTNMVSICIAT